MDYINDERFKGIKLLDSRAFLASPTMHDKEMLMNEEGLKETPNKLIHIGKPIEMDDESFKKQLERLESACKSERCNTQ